MQRRVEPRVHRGDEGAVPEAQLGDEFAVALAGGDMEKGAALRRHLAGAAPLFRVGRGN